MRRALAVVTGAIAVALASCTPAVATPKPTPAVAGGTLTVGVWKEPVSFLDAGIVGDAAFAGVLAAPAQEGLLWYRSRQEVQRSTSEADYWAPDLAVEVPTTVNGDVKTSGCDDAGAAMCVTWKLRQGVQWHDGHPFSSHDVCDTYQLFWLQYGAQHHSNPTSLATTAGWNQVLSCTEADRYTAVVDFRSQYGSYLTLGSGVYGILPATFLDAAFGQDLAAGAASATVNLAKGSGNSAAFQGQASLDRVLDGTGPFVLQSYTPGSQLVLVANTRYWNAQERAHLDKLVFKIEPDVATEVKDTLSGAIQLGLDMRLSNLPALQAAASGASPGMTVNTIPAAGAEKIDFNLCATARVCGSLAAKTNAYTADPTVRKAFLLGIDRAAIAQAVAPGLTQVPKDSWMYLGAAYLNSSTVPQTAFDEQAANLMLDAAGYVRDTKCGVAPDAQAYRHWKDGSCIVVNLGTTSDDALRLMVESMLQADLQRIGINVPSPFSPNVAAAMFFDTFARGGPLYTHAFDTAMFALTLSLPGDPDAFSADYHGDCGGTCAGELEIPSSANGGAGMNDTGVSDPALDSDLDRARSTADLTKRASLYIQAEQRLAAVLPEIPLFQQVIVNSSSVRLHGVKDNDLVWDFNSADWYCSAGPDGRGECTG